MAESRSRRSTEVCETVGPAPLTALNTIRIGQPLPQASCTYVPRLPDSATPHLLYHGMEPQQVPCSPIRPLGHQAV